MKLLDPRGAVERVELVAMKMQQSFCYQHREKKLVGITFTKLLTATVGSECKHQTFAALTGK